MQKTYFSNYANEIKFTVQKLLISTYSVKDEESNQMWAFNLPESFSFTKVSVKYINDGLILGIKPGDCIF